MKNDFYSLGLLVSRVSVALAKSLNSAFEYHGIDLPHSQFIVLRCLYYKDGISQLDIAKLLFKDAAAIKRTVDLLEKKELVERRLVRTLKNSVYITERGKMLMPSVLEISDAIIENALAGIDIADRELLQGMLDKIYINLDNTQI